MLAALALGEDAADAREGGEYLELAKAIALETGLLVPVTPAPSRPDEVETDGVVEVSGPPLAIRLLGDFELRVRGRPVDLSAVRPRARALLRLLSLNAGIAVHHETIEAALWPEADRESSTRNLHVAIAAVRRALEPSAPRGAFHVVRREGDAYRLAVPSGSEVDLLRFERAVAAGHLARQRSDGSGAASLYQEALAWYRGDLLPEDGPAEWVAERRELCRLAAVEAAQGLAEILLARGDADGAARVCATGLRIERYHDPLWRLLIRSRAQAGDLGAANRARLGYDRMLAELGVTAPSALG
jgi:DNA-binding SARP family transcriptional activator